MPILASICLMFDNKKDSAVKIDGQAITNINS